jgi:hypothetical protein
VKATVSVRLWWQKKWLQSIGKLIVAMTTAENLFWHNSMPKLNKRVFGHSSMRKHWLTEVKHCATYTQRTFEILVCSRGKALCT